MNSLSLKIATQEFPLEDLKVIKCILRRKNLSADDLVLEKNDAPAIDSLQYETPIELWQDGTCRFAGQIEKIRHKGSYTSSTKEIIAQNAFAEFEKIIFQQKSFVYCNNILSVRDRSKVVLGQAFDGTKLSVSEQAKQIINYAISKSVRCEIGTIDIDCEMLFDECIDITCADALKRILKWSPACCLFFDYSTTIPTINILKRTSLEDSSIDVECGLVKSFNANKRDDLAVSSVAIKYERENVYDGEAFLEFEEDIYPQNADVGGRRSAVMYVELAGAKSVCQKHSIKTETIQTDSKQWWKNHVSFLNEVDDFDIVEVSRLSKLSNELVEGTIIEDMNCNFERDTISGTFFYTAQDGSELTKKIALKLVATSASTGTFYIWKQKQTAERAPIGLARAIYEASCVLQYDGEINIFDRKTEDFFAKNISIYKGSEQISSLMPAYWSEENLLRNNLKIKFGPPKHLYTDDIAEIFRINRSRKISSQSVDTSSGKITASTVVIGGQNASTLEAESNNEYSRMIINTTNSEKSIDLNPSELNSAQTAKLTDAYVCYNGELARAFILSTAPTLV